MKCQGLYLRSPCKDSWFEVDQWVIKIMTVLEVAIPLALGKNRCCLTKLCEGQEHRFWIPQMGERSEDGARD